MSTKLSTTAAENRHSYVYGTIGYNKQRYKIYEFPLYVPTLYFDKRKMMSEYKNVFLHDTQWLSNLCTEHNINLQAITFLSSRDDI